MHFDSHLFSGILYGANDGLKVKFGPERQLDLVSLRGFSVVDLPVMSLLSCFVDPLMKV